MRSHLSDKYLKYLESMNKLFKELGKELLLRGKLPTHVQGVIPGKVDFRPPKAVHQALAKLSTLQAPLGSKAREHWQERCLMVHRILACYGGHGEVSPLNVGRIHERMTGKYKHLFSLFVTCPLSTKVLSCLSGFQITYLYDKDGKNKTGMMLTVWAKQLPGLSGARYTGAYHGISLLSTGDTFDWVQGVKYAFPRLRKAIRKFIRTTLDTCWVPKLHAQQEKLDPVVEDYLLNLTLKEEIVPGVAELLGLMGPYPNIQEIERRGSLHRMRWAARRIRQIPIGDGQGDPSLAVEAITEKG